MAAASRPLRILLLDNYDSYTYNLFQLVARVNGGEKPVVVANDQLTVEELHTLMQSERTEAVVISPGPGTPTCQGDVGLCRALCEQYPNMPILGVCLGHQILGHVHGASIVNTTPRDFPHHGRLSAIKHDKSHDALFKGTDPDGASRVVRYHSLCVRLDSPEARASLVPTAWADPDEQGDGEPVIMAMRHATRPHHGVQFHPESVLTADGEALVRNFLDYVRAYWTTADDTNVRATRPPHPTPPPHTSVCLAVLPVRRLGAFASHTAREWAVLLLPCMIAAKPYRITTVSEACRRASIATPAGPALFEGDSRCAHRYTPSQELVSNSPSKRRPMSLRAPLPPPPPQLPLSFAATTTANRHRAELRAEDQPVRWRVLYRHAEFPPTNEMNVDVAERLFWTLIGPRREDCGWWLDTSGGVSEGRGRYSFLGGRGGPFWKQASYYRVADSDGVQPPPTPPASPAEDATAEDTRRLVFESSDGRRWEPTTRDKPLTLWEYVEMELEGNVIATVEDVMACESATAASWPFDAMDFFGGLVGYLGYETGDDGTMEVHAPAANLHGGMPDALLQFADRWIAVDHRPANGGPPAAYIFALVPESGSAPREPCAGTSDVSGRAGDAAPAMRTNDNTSSQAGSVSAGNDGEEGRAQSKPLDQQLAWIETVACALERIVDTAMSAKELPTDSTAPTETVPVDSEPFVPRRTRDEYEEDVRACQEFMRTGESYELCLTTQLTRSPVCRPSWRPNAALATTMCGSDASPLADALTRRANMASGGEIAAPAADDAEYLWLAACYHKLRRLNPAPYAAFLSAGVGQPDSADAPPVLLCSSPERFLRLTRDSTLEARPIKGTAARVCDDPAQDAVVAAALVDSEKDIAENLMICDLLRNDLGRVCEVGSVDVPAFAQLESYATVHQLVSVVTGRRRRGVGPAECVRAAFPPGSMTGAPKRRSVALLRRLEGEPLRDAPGAAIAGGRLRGAYSGSIGYFSFRFADDATAPLDQVPRGCALNLNVVIRTAVAVGGKLHIGAGGAITVLSDAHEEWEEVRVKAERLLRAVGATDAGAVGHAAECAPPTHVLWGAM